MSGDLELYDLTIIGGGPAGLYAAFYGGMRDMKTKLIEAKLELGGRLLTYPEKMIWDVGGVTPIRCEQLIRQMVEQALTFEPTVAFGQQIKELERLDDGTMILTSDTGERHHTRTVLIAAGFGVANPNKLELEGADRYEVSNLYYTVTSLEAFRGKHVLVSGGSDAAVDWAMELEPIAASVTLVHRRDRIGGHEVNVKYLLEQSSIRVMAPYVIAKLYGNAAGNAIESVSLAPADENGRQTGGEQERIAFDAVIINHGYKGNLEDFKRWGVEFDDYRIRAFDKMATSLPGVFVAGDPASFANKLNLIAGAISDAAVAVNGAKKYLEPSAFGMAYVSSHNGIFNERNKALQAKEERA
ncbi:NAD(P)/FAD-dependent oxidoreductase [Cohnella sp. GCM10027633]|uniref:NAD(P)/FAD-dependent oxidoreductase n=1 Tax=unclassified Cohnella TaxID=2636738 RepID=UPI00363F476B